MKIAEIVNRQNTEYRAAAKLDLEHTHTFLRQDAVLVTQLAGTYQLWKKSVAEFLHFYFITSGSNIAGWVGLKPQELNGIQVHAIDLIFFDEPYRGTRAVPLLLHAVRAELGEPIAISADDAIFRGGSQLLNALVKRDAIKMSALSPDGVRTAITDLAQAGRGDAILIEDAAPLHLPAKDLLGQPSGVHLIDWFNDKDEFI